MPIDFKVNVNVESHGTEKIDALEKQINSLKNNPIKIKVDVDKSALSNINLKAGTIKVKPTVILICDDGISILNIRKCWEDTLPP